MAWRLISHGEDTWHVNPAAERHANSAGWQLVFSFRPSERKGTPRTLWAPYPIAAPNRASLFAQADLVSDVELAALLERLKP